MVRLWKRHGFFSKYSDFRVARLGRRDGRLDPPVPAWEAADPPPGLREIGRAGNGDLQATAQAWESEDAKLNPAWEASEDRAAAAAERAAEAERALAAAEGAYEARREGKAPPSGARFLLYRLAVTGMTFLELPFNLVVFRSLGESEVMTAFFALGLSCVLIALAHFAGGMAKDGRRVPAAVTGLLAVGILLGVAWIRSLYLAARPVAEDGVRFPQGPTLLVFFLFNLGLFAVACLCAHAAHDDLLQVVYQARRQLKAAQAALAAARRIRDKAVAKRKKRHAHHYALAARTIWAVARIFEVHRTANLQVRPDRAMHPGSQYPASYDKHGLAHMPECLETLSWQRGAGAVAAKPRRPVVGALGGKLVATTHGEAPPADPASAVKAPSANDPTPSATELVPSGHPDRSRNNGHVNDNGLTKGATLP